MLSSVCEYVCLMPKAIYYLFFFLFEFLLYQLLSLVTRKRGAIFILERGLYASKWLGEKYNDINNITVYSIFYSVYDLYLMLFYFIFMVSSLIKASSYVFFKKNVT